MEPLPGELATVLTGCGPAAGLPVATPLYNCIKIAKLQDNVNKDRMLVVVGAFMAMTI